jgi:hypothetical protein
MTTKSIYILVASPLPLYIFTSHVSLLTERTECDPIVLYKKLEKEASVITIYTQIDDHSLSWLGTGASIKSDVVGLS